MKNYESLIKALNPLEVPPNTKPANPELIWELYRQNAVIFQTPNITNAVACKLEQAGITSQEMTILFTNHLNRMLYIPEQGGCWRPIRHRFSASIREKLSVYAPNTTLYLCSQALHTLQNRDHFIRKWGTELRQSYEVAMLLSLQIGTVSRILQQAKTNAFWSPQQ